MTPFDPVAATAAYLNTLNPADLARSAQYTAGNHWILLWNVVVSAFVCWLIVRTRILERLGTRLARRGPNLRTFLVALTYFGVSALLGLPWLLYAEWSREWSYQRTQQPLGDFLVQSLLQNAIGALIGAVFMVGVYALIRRAGRRWWIWASGLAVVAFTTFLLLSPTLIEPLFNEFKPIPPGEVRDALLPMAKSAGVPEDRLFVYDGSRQSKNFTANVAGLGGSARIAISDVAFQGATLDEVKAVTGHEIGHFVLGHVWRMVMFAGALAIAFFWFTDRVYPVVARALGTRAELMDPAGLPVLMLIVAVMGLMAAPFSNALIRRGEVEADVYSLQTVNLPDGLATALLKTAEYRYPKPSPMQEFLFYTHPSVERRILRAMEWKAKSVGLTGHR